MTSAPGFICGTISRVTDSDRHIRHGEDDHIGRGHGFGGAEKP